MRLQSFTTISNVLLLLIGISITELISQDVFEDEIREQPINIISSAIDADVLNPIYIFK